MSGQCQALSSNVPAEFERQRLRHLQQLWLCRWSGLSPGVSEAACLSHCMLQVCQVSNWGVCVCLML